MTVAVGLLLAAVAIAVVGPAYLRPAGNPRVHPALALCAWVAALLAAGGAAVLAAAVLLLPDPSVPDGAVGLAVTCWRAFSRGTDVPWLLVIRLVVGLALLVLMMRVAAVFTRQVWRERAHRRDRIAALRAVARVEDGVWWIPSDDPVAFSVGGGRSGVVVASTGILRFGPDVTRAVLAHELAHVRGRHHLAVALARAAARALPRVPLCRAAPGAVGVLCELAADAAAVRGCGPAAISRALQVMAAEDVPRGAVGFGAHPRSRLSWLSGPRPFGLRGSGPCARGTAAAAALVPALLPGAGAVALVLVACAAP